mmetsp:Transcript_45628/g.97480  ORF Transcript_45628/g.97480 Transcript_45628/m.97480 type:complete len:506 (-) Transcript_45628:124-1641(-)
MAPPLPWRAMAALLALGAPAAAAAQDLGSAWRDLGPGGCRDSGGLYDKRRVRRGLVDVAECRAACETDAACTGIVFGDRDGQTYCHILGGGPYVHADGINSDFVCQARQLNCTMPTARFGYDVSTCGSVAADGISAPQPPCHLLRCAVGFVGSPVARCLLAEGTFQLEGCATLSSAWAAHGPGDCQALGARPSFATRRSATRAACQAACQDEIECGAVTYDSNTSRCDIFALAPPAHTVAALAVSGGRALLGGECWRLGEPSPLLAAPTTAVPTAALVFKAAPDEDEKMPATGISLVLFISGLLCGTVLAAVACAMRRHRLGPFSPKALQAHGNGKHFAWAQEGCGADLEGATAGTEKATPVEAFGDAPKPKAQLLGLRCAGAPGDTAPMGPGGGSPRSCHSGSTRASTPAEPVPDLARPPASNRATPRSAWAGEQVLAAAPVPERRAHAGRVMLSPLNGRLPRGEVASALPAAGIEAAPAPPDLSSGDGAIPWEIADHSDDDSV